MKSNLEDRITIYGGLLLNRLRDIKPKAEIIGEFKKIVVDSKKGHNQFHYCVRIEGSPIKKSVDIYADNYTNLRDCVTVYDESIKEDAREIIKEINKNIKMSLMFFCDIK